MLSFCKISGPAEAHRQMPAGVPPGILSTAGQWQWDSSLAPVQSCGFGSSPVVGSNSAPSGICASHTDGTTGGQYLSCGWDRAPGLCKKQTCIPTEADPHSLLTFLIETGRVCVPLLQASLGSLCIDTHRTHCVTLVLSTLRGTNRPEHRIGRVLSEHTGLQEHST